MITGYSRLIHLARVLRERSPHYRNPQNPVRMYAVLTPEQRVVLEGLAAEAGVKATQAFQLLMDAVLSQDRVLVRWVFFGEEPGVTARNRILAAARKEASVLDKEKRTVTARG